MESVTLPDDPEGPRAPRWDWRDHIKLSAPKDQDGSELCMALALCAAIEARHSIAHPLEPIELAPGFVHCCLGNLLPSQPYDTSRALPKVVQYGMAYAPPSLLPYDRSVCSDWLDGTKQTYRIANSQIIRGPNHAKNTILSGGPIIAKMWLIPSFKTYRGGVYRAPPAASTGVPGQNFDTHVVCVIGYDNQNQCWIVKNSWGEDWGSEGGFGEIAYGSCALLLSSSIAVSRATQAFEIVL